MLFSKPILSSLFLLLSTSSAVHAADIYVSPSGSDSAAGTQTAPLKSIQSAIASSNLTPGSTIYLRAGTYALTSNIQITSKGTSSSPYTLRSYSNEKVIIDAEALPYTPGALDASVPNKDRGAIHIEGASNWRFLGLEIIHGAYGVFLRDSNDCYFESIITRDNYETGFHMQGASAHNKVYYLDSYGNRDPRKNGESADGFACKEGSGEGNMLIGARLWNNVDDGLDLWEFKSAVTIEDTLSYGNGFNRWGFTDFQGDGNGFKLGGGSDAASKGPANHVVRNSFAFDNAAGGFVDNSQPGKFQLTRSTAWNNGGTGFKFGTSSSTLMGNIAVGNKGGETALTGSQSASGNSWNGSGGKWSNSSFVEIDETVVRGARQAGGKVACSQFLVPTSGQAIGARTC